MALSVEKITFAYTREGRPILQQFSAQFSKDAITVLTGASGCGKSTLLYLMAGIYPGDAGFLREGVVTVDGQDPAQLPPPVVAADETAFDVEFQVGVPKPDIAPWRQVSVAVPLPEPGENAGQKVLPVMTDREDVGDVQRMCKIPPPRMRSSSHARALISVISPSGVSVTAPTDSMLSVSVSDWAPVREAARGSL